MSGTSNGMAQHNLTGCRVANKVGNEMIYTPAHIKPDGKFVSARLSFRVLINEYGGDPNDPDGYRVVAWGGRADMFAKNLARGKELNLYCTSKSFRANVYDKNGTQVMNADGTPLQVNQLSFTIRDFTFGGDGDATILEEMQAGIRPDGWNIPNSAGHAAWLGILAQRKTQFYQGGDKYGYARVIAPKTPNCQILLGDQSGRAREAVAAPLTTQIAAALPTAQATSVLPPAAAPGVVAQPQANVV